MLNTDMLDSYARIEKQLISTGMPADLVKVAVESNDSFIFTHRQMNELNSCQACKLCSNKVPGVGNINSPLMFIGEGTGHNEVSTGIPFTDAAGTALIVLLNAMGIDRHNIWMTNATRCNRFNDSLKKYETPEPDEIEACKTFLSREIVFGKPKVIVALGNPAMHALTGNYNLKISHERGNFIDLDPIFGVKAKVMFTWHPSYLIRQPAGDAFDKVKSEMWSDLCKAVLLAQTLEPAFDFKTRPTW
jgi:DNA polymerase